MAVLYLLSLLSRGNAVAQPPAVPGIDWAPPIDLGTSAIIAQALRLMRLPPVSRIDPEAEVLAALREAFDQAVDDCLEVADWSFASVLAVLPPADLPTGDIADAGMVQAYQPPGDMIRLRQVMPSCTDWRLDKGLLRAAATGALTIRYTARVTLEVTLPATFQLAVSLHIAARLGARWAGAVIAADDLASQAKLTLLQAQRNDARHAAEARLTPANDNLGYDGGGSDWAMGAVA